MKELKNYIARRDDLWDMIEFIMDTTQYDSHDIAVVPAFRWDEDDYSEAATDNKWFYTVQSALTDSGINIDMQKVKDAWWKSNGSGIKVLKALFKNN